ncbi:Leucyl/phenylalanyl-tRNA--protein transferase [Aquimixticola soesokkakensis]|uniref:Leucyl/phenylalanyl-tRNA--protein transferase n=1 Tax=Aquimixticola soesokkakensis TaxID=1519096 RepID=A0A1Y5T7W4_9RHOB|nr:leucyl/phenylalanyl-tRNA--protein transferase [Aquimixticola soesokkakensis]SLN57410.1 Leucyl/phenylalanyl-tRNA--protein transferase [Aquimixticola soesokkakensis]
MDPITPALLPAITPELLLNAYASGVFPMAESEEESEIFWVDPRQRGVFDLDRFHISRSLAKTLKSQRFDIRINHDFAATLRGCADRAQTWINAEIFELYSALHEMGYAHSIEVWRENRLVGGTYGVALQGAWFGESMFSRETDASKVALAYTVAHLRAGGFTLFDTQFLTPHLASLGAIEISRATYRKQLGVALGVTADFAPRPPSLYEVLQLRTQTSYRG